MQPGKQFDLFPEVLPTGSRRSRRKPATLEKNKVNHVIAKDRYYYHRRLDKDLFDLDPDTRIIRCKFPCRCLNDIPASQRTYRGEPTGQRYYISELIALGYNVQYELF